jgi:hypothetical protein
MNTDMGKAHQKQQITAQAKIETNALAAQKNIIDRKQTPPI